MHLAWNGKLLKWECLGKWWGGIRAMTTKMTSQLRTALHELLTTNDDIWHLNEHWIKKSTFIEKCKKIIWTINKHDTNKINMNCVKSNKEIFFDCWRTHSAIQLPPRPEIAAAALWCYLYAAAASLPAQGCRRWARRLACDPSRGSS